ncbi:hypothetical protein GCM10027160_47290 [Streptomyces calidiresistens]|uniref:Uncharacterized protein n=1 Tax=Streptomyces calidiresistens TaxID=1485586 RepID=A0A7W3XWP5_9ACTN|nr:hypothetical protein [Streptomyces calidiresistens]MBB0229957.1 hypothetical protein [Streptomyces calidiresistens]
MVTFGLLDGTSGMVARRRAIPGSIRVDPTTESSLLDERYEALRRRVLEHLRVLGEGAGSRAGGARPVAVPAGYWCEAVARCADGEGEWLLAGHCAEHPTEALRWLRDRARRLADALDPPWTGELPAPEHGGPGAGWFLRSWLGDRRRQAAQVAALTAGRWIGVDGVGTDRVCGGREVEVRYTLSCRPLPVLRRWGDPVSGLLR